MVKKINLNADMGEGFGAYSIGNDDSMLAVVNSANIACGYHAGDPMTMSDVVDAAVKQNVSIGAHPSFPDLQGFGRRKMHFSPDELQKMIIYQIGALSAIAKSKGGVVTHVKPHGALNNMAAVDMDLANAVGRAVKALGGDLILLAPAGSCMIRAAQKLKIRVASEVFADRTYDEDGNLTPRDQVGAVIHDANQSADQILSFLEAGKIMTPSGAGIDTEIHSVCVHGDNENAIKIAKKVKERLELAGYECAQLPDII